LRWIEPPWKATSPTKAFLPLLWEMFPGHPNLLPAFSRTIRTQRSSAPPSCASHSIPAKGPIVALISGGVTVVEQEGPYGAESFIRQALAARCPNFSGQYPVVGSWLIDHTPCGLSIREDENPITGNSSRFLPHAISRPLRESL